MSISNTHHFAEAQQEILESGIFLWISHADKIPPHIGISLDGNYFSLKVDGKDDIQTKVIFRTIQQKKIPGIFVKLNENVFSPGQFLQVKNEYQFIDGEVKTCLVPILALFGLEKESFLLHDFLKYLSEKQFIVGYFALNLPPDFKGLQTYSLEDVTSHLQKIKHAERSKHISPSH